MLSSAGFHLLEYYCAYWNYIDNMNFTEALFKELLMKLNGSLKLTYEGTEISFEDSGPASPSVNLSSGTAESISINSRPGMN